MGGCQNTGLKNLASIVLIGAGILLLLVSLPSWLWVSALGLILIAAGLILWRLG